MTHRELIDGCVRGKRTAQDELYHRYAGRLFAVSLRYTRNRMEAEDLLQESFVKIFKNIHTVKSDNEKLLFAWMRRVLINHTLNYLRDQRHFRFMDDLDINSEDWAAEGVEQDLDHQFDRMSPEQIIDLISALPEGYRTVFNMYAIEEYTHQEIADALGISVSTSKTQLMKARKALMEAIQKKSPDAPVYKLVV